MKTSHRGSFAIIVLFIFILILSSTVVPGLPYSTSFSSSFSAIKEAAAQEQGGDGEGETPESEEEAGEGEGREEEEKEGENTAEEDLSSSSPKPSEVREQMVTEDEDGYNNENHPPTADAGQDLTVDESTLEVTLSGNGVDEDPNDTLTYLWRQVVQGEVQLEVTLNDADTAQATFDAPSNIDEDITLTFELTVSDGTVENKDTVNVLVRDGGGVPSATADETKQTPTGEVQEEERTQPVEEGEQNPESQSTQQPSSSSGEEQEGEEEEEDPLAEDDDTNTDTASSPTTTDSAVITSSPNTDDNTNAMTSSSELELQAEGVPEENVQSGTGSFVVTYDLAMADGSDGGDGSIHIRYSGTIRLEAEGDSYRYTISSAEGQCESDQLIDPHTNPPTVATIMYTASADRSDFWLNGDGTLTLLVMGVTTDPRSTIQYCGWPQSISRELPYTIENGIIRSAHSGPIACTNCIVHISWDISVPAPPNMLPPEENNRPPTASAGADQTVNEGDTVTLDGTGSSDPDGDSLRFRWTPQTQSSAVILSDDTSSTPTFTAPEVEADTTLTFELVVNDGKVDSASDTVDVLVSNTEQQPPEQPPGECPNDSESAEAPDSHLKVASGDSSNCQPKDDFSLKCDPFDPAKIYPGESSKTTCTIKSVNGFKDPVNIDCASLIPEVTCGANPTSVTPPANGEIKTELGVSFSKGTALGSRTIYVTGTSGSLTPHRVTMTLECATCLEPRTELQVTSKAGRDSIEKEEGYAGIWPDHCTPKKQTNCKVSGDKYGLYHDSRGICTKGIGHRVIETQSEGPCTPETISEFRREFKAGMPYAEAYKQFLKDIKREGEDPVNRNLKVKLTQEQFDALVSFSFNAGMGSLVKSPLLKDINAGKCDPDTIRADFLAWPNKDRRAKEANLFISGEYF